MSVTFEAGTSIWSEDFQADLLTATSPEELAVNMANGNAARVTEALGIVLDSEWCGEMAAEGFLGRVLMALALSPADEGMPSFEMKAGDDAGIFGIIDENGPRVIQGARRPCYLQDRLTELHELADWAVSNGALIMWA